MAELRELVAYLDGLLKPALYKDASKNGLQVDSGNARVDRVAAAVDSGLSVIEEAAAGGAQLLLVHHGLLWGDDLPLTGPFGRKIGALYRSGCSLYASHLPLDGNEQVGNNFELGRFLNLTNLEGFFDYHGMPIGCRGETKVQSSLDEIASACEAIPGATKPLVLPFGPHKVRKIGIVTGSGSSALEECAHAGLDLLISGEPKQAAFHTCKELGINAIFAGHYGTETFGVKALLQRLQHSFGVTTLFVDQPTGI